MDSDPLEVLSLDMIRRYRVCTIEISRVAHMYLIGSSTFWCTKAADTTSCELGHR